MDIQYRQVGARALGIVALISFAMTSAASFELDLPAPPPGLAISSIDRARAGFELGAESIVQWGGVDIVVDGYSVPLFVDWNNDGWIDVLIGSSDGTVRLYLNVSLFSDGFESGDTSEWSNSVPWTQRILGPFRPQKK